VYTYPVLVGADTPPDSLLVDQRAQLLPHTEQSLVRRQSELEVLRFVILISRYLVAPKLVREVYLGKRPTNSVDEHLVM
jgi:hypothetical protein